MRPGAGLAESVWELLHQALDLYRDDRHAAARLHHHLSRFDQPLRIAVTGSWRSGKSTLVNAIMGEEVAPVEIEDGRQVFTWYEDGPSPEVIAYSADGAARELAATRSASGMRVDLGGWRSDQVDDIVVKWPTRALRHITLVDTPAVAPTGEDGGTAYADRLLRDADAVLYLTRDARGTDLEFLRSLQDSGVARAAPANVILVLARADEVGGGRVDALVTARQLARRRHHDPGVSSVCTAVVALGGLVAVAGRVLTESDFAALAALAATPRAELDAYLLSADRFVSAQFAAPVTPEVRRALLDRLGIFGVRLATTLARTGCDTRAKLAAELVRRSGLTELRECIARHFTDRSDVLRARSALLALESILRQQPRPGTPDLLAWVEYLLAGAHDFRELRLLADLQDPQLGFDTELTAEAQRLVGGNGTDLATRLGADHQAGGAELWELGSQALGRWQNHAEDPLASLDRRRAAAVVVRSCEGILAQLSGH
ncbi:dynamin family protein [Planosporangium sp. 12N6]|uniref:dynamin family protein n=1 Tax=Planosporangium spinosum TaxID=3402278 RepID=UPI003CF55B1F